MQKYLHIFGLSLLGSGFRSANNGQLVVILRTDNVLLVNVLTNILKIQFVINFKGTRI